MHPDLFQIGDYTVHTYGAAFFVSLSLGTLLAYRRARAEGIDRDRFVNAVILAVVGILVGSKLFHVVTSWERYADRPERILDLRTGHAFYGGYLGAILLPYVYLRWVREPVLRMLDVWMTYSGLGIGLHRTVGCLCGGCCYGRPTDLPWGITFPPGSPAARAWGEVPVHPTQIYEALAAFATFAALLYFRKHHKKVHGELFGLFLLLCGVGRFVVEFFRGDPTRGSFAGLSTTQWISIGMVGGAGVVMAWTTRKRRVAEGAAADGGTDGVDEGTAPDGAAEDGSCS